MKLYDIEALLSFISNKGFKDENINSNDRDEYYFQKGWNSGVLWVMEAIATLMPELHIEAEPVRHGYWIEGRDGSCMCSECGKVSRYEIGYYCSKCGAKMDLPN